MPHVLQRPALHFTPQRGWINDPNGLLWDGTRYHLFAQHNPHDAVWGPMHWLHATSGDMLHWREVGIALYPDEIGAMFSGSAAKLADGRMALMYTAHGEREQQCVAFSKDGFCFEKYGANPVIRNEKLKDFRDPKLFWNRIRGCWSAVIAAGDHVEFYCSDDLIDWRKTGAFTPTGKHRGELFECPDLLFLQTPEGEPVAVLTASMIFRGEETGCRMQAFLGGFDGDSFHQTQSTELLRLDVGYDSYAGVTFAGLEEPVLMNWMSATSCPLPTAGYCGCLSLPRGLRLVRADGALRLAQTPVLPPYAWEAAGEALPQGAFALRLRAGGPFALELLDEAGAAALRVWADEAGRLCTTRRQSDAFAPDSCYNRDGYRMTCIPRAVSGPIEVIVICDGYCVEIFADAGTYAHGLLVFPEGKWARLNCTEANRLELARLS